MSKEVFVGALILAFFALGGKLDTGTPLPGPGVNAEGVTDEQAAREAARVDEEARRAADRAAWEEAQRNYDRKDNGRTTDERNDGTEQG